MAGSEDLLRRLANPSAQGQLQPGVDGSVMQELKGDALTTLRNLGMLDPGVDYSGIPSAMFRADFGAMDTDQERAAFLNERTGIGGWTQDKFGMWAITPSGQKKLGLKPKDKPITIEDRGAFTGYDVADWAGNAPAVIGAVAGGYATGGGAGLLGLLRGMLGAGGGALLGKGVGEGVEQLAGANLQPASSVVRDMAFEGLMGGAGEGIYRGALAPAGRWLMAPQAKRMTPGAAKLMQQAREVGAQPNVQQVTKAPLLGRWQSMTNRILGDPLQEQNQRALTREMANLRRAAGPKLRGRETLGETIRGDIGNARQALSKWAEGAYGQVNDLVQGQPVVRTQELKSAAKDILDSLPKSVKEEQNVVTSPILGPRGESMITGVETVTKEGPPVLTSGETVSALRGIDELPESVTIPQMQRVSSKLWDMVDDRTLVPGISSRDARLLHKASRRALLDLTPDAPPDAAGLLKGINDEYERRITQFDDALINRITRDPSVAGMIEPERILDSVFRYGQAARLKRVMRLLPDTTKLKMRRAATEDILRDAVARTDDPMRGLFTGKNFLNSLDKYGRGTLEAMFGKEHAARLYRFGNVSQFVNQKMAQSGGLVAASIALHPWRNFGRLVGLRVASRVMNSPKGLKWLTQGLEAPKTRAGAEAISRLTTQIQLLEDEHNRGENAPGLVSRLLGQ